MKDFLRTQWLAKSFQYFDEIDSTNTYLKQHAGELPNGAAVLAARQTAGRGRLGRAWQDNGKPSLALSVLLHKQTVENLSLLPLLAGLAVRRALEKLTGLGLQLKWSNDVLLENQKLCGILCESRIQAGDSFGAFAVVGIGVNLEQTRDEFDLLDLVYATSLKLATGKSLEILPVAAEILYEFEQILDIFEKNSFEALREEYKNSCITLGREVRIISGNNEQIGMAVDIGKDGALICEIDGRLVNINAGEASVRGIYGYV